MTPQEASAEARELRPELPHALALRVLTQGVTDGITILDASGRLVYVNEVAATSAGIRHRRGDDLESGRMEGRIEFQDARGGPST